MQTVDYDLVKAKMAELKVIFDDYNDILTKMDENVNSSIQNGVDSAIMDGKLGPDFLSKWQTTAESFSSFKNDFDSIYGKVGTMTKNTADLEDNTTALFYTTESDAIGATGGSAGVHSGGGGGSTFVTNAIK